MSFLNRSGRPLHPRKEGKCLPPPLPPCQITDDEALLHSDEEGLSQRKQHLCSDTNSWDERKTIITSCLTFDDVMAVATAFADTATAHKPCRLFFCDLRDLSVLKSSFVFLRKESITETLFIGDIFENKNIV